MNVISIATLDSGHRRSVFSPALENSATKNHDLADMFLRLMRFFLLHETRFVACLPFLDSPVRCHAERGILSGR
jgi:hypothetical protein